MKKGDKVIFNEEFRESVIGSNKRIGNDIPVKDKEYIISNSLYVDSFGEALIIEGLHHGNSGGWKSEAWLKPNVKPDVISTEASRTLVKTLVVEKIGTEKDKYLEEERELKFDADF